MTAASSTPSWRLALADLTGTEGDGIIVPRAEPRELLKVGWFAKLRFIPMAGVRVRFVHEDHWVRVVRAHDDGTKYEGMLVTAPQKIPGLEIAMLASTGPSM